MPISLHDIIHNIIISFGLIISITSIFVILRKTPHALKEYSVLLFNMSLTELLSITLHGLLDGRLFVSPPSSICMSNGPCRAISERFCAVLSAILFVVMIHSTALVALSFWSRARIISGADLLRSGRLQLLAVSLFLPHLAYIGVYVWTMTPRENLIKKVDRFHDAASFGLYGYEDVTEFVPSMCMSYLGAFGVAEFTYIMWARFRLLGVLQEKTSQMSVRTRSTHESLTKILTIHAVCSICVTCGIVSLVLVQLQNIHSENIEGTILDLAVVPSLVNPVLTLYFVRPYRMFVTNLICVAQKRVSFVHSVSNYDDHGAPKLSLSQKL